MLARDVATARRRLEACRRNMCSSPSEEDACEEERLLECLRCSEEWYRERVESFERRVTTRVSETRLPLHFYGLAPVAQAVIAENVRACAFQQQWDLERAKHQRLVNIARQRLARELAEEARLAQLRRESAAPRAEYWRAVSEQIEREREAAAPPRKRPRGGRNVVESPDSDFISDETLLS